MQGQVLAEFVVGPDGLADVGSFQVIRSTDARFTAAVKAALPNMRFQPAEVEGGRRVRSLVEMPFEFSPSP